MAAGNGLAVALGRERGRIAALRTADGAELLDAAAPHALGQVVVETLKDPAHGWSWPTAISSSCRSSSATSPPRSCQRDGDYRLCVEPLDGLAAPLAAPRRTTLGRAEVRAAGRADHHHLDPRDGRPGGDFIWRFRFHCPAMIYGSAGRETVFGRDSLPGTCRRGVVPQRRLDLPQRVGGRVVGYAGYAAGLSGRNDASAAGCRPLTPAGARYYVNVAGNYWHTNFSILKAGKLVVRHWIEPADPQRASLAMLSDELWAYPITSCSASPSSARPAGAARLPGTSLGPTPQRRLVADNLPLDGDLVAHRDQAAGQRAGHVNVDLGVVGQFEVQRLGAEPDRPHVLVKRAKVTRSPPGARPTAPPALGPRISWRPCERTFDARPRAGGGTILSSWILSLSLIVFSLASAGSIVAVNCTMSPAFR